MATYYVGIGGNDGNNGTTWALRKLTLNGAEDIPVAANDTVYVGPGTYRELLTVDVSGTTSNPITYIGDYDGTHTDGVGGVVRITGSADDIALTRANCITATSKDYRTFRGFYMDGCSSYVITLLTACGNWIIDQCYLMNCKNDRTMTIAGTGTTNTIKNCFFWNTKDYSGIAFTHSSVVDNAAHTVQNCIFLSGGPGVRSTRIGGITIKNNLFMGGTSGIQVDTALTLGQTIVVNNNLFVNLGTALQGTVTGEIVENYNNFIGCTTNRTNTDTGANSLVDLIVPDARWFFELVSGKGRMLSPFDLSSGSPLLNVAGTSPSSTDMRNTGTVGTQREWGALEYDSTLLYRRVLPRGI